MKSFKINWKTTAGAVGAIFTGLGVIVHAATVAPVDYNTIGATAVTIVGAIGLLFAKDSNVTGGTKQQ